MKMTGPVYKDGQGPGIGVTFQLRVRSVVGRKQRCGDAAILGQVCVCAMERAERRPEQ